MKKICLSLFCLIICNQVIFAQLIYGKTNPQVNINCFRKLSNTDTTTTRKISPVILSVLVPGLGDYALTDKNNSSIRKKMQPWIITTVVYGLIGTGIYLKIQSDKNYQLYHDAIEQSVMDDKYSLANSQYKNLFSFISTGIAIWVADVLLVAKKKSKIKNKAVTLSAVEKSNIFFNYDLKNKAVTFSYNISMK